MGQWCSFRPGILKAAYLRRTQSRVTSSRPFVWWEFDETYDPHLVSLRLSVSLDENLNTTVSRSNLTLVLAANRQLLPSLTLFFHERRSD